MSIATAKKPAKPVILNPPLHVVLSAEAREKLERIKLAQGWNNKSAIERLIRFYDMNGAGLDFSNQQ
jgi:hypothetical protein